MTETKPKILDLFCGAGGASAGYARAGFDVVGVDIEPQPHYPYEFIQADAIVFLDTLTWLELLQFSAIHASPPCQAYSVLRKRNAPAEYPDLVEPVRDRLIDCDLPWVIENVPGSPLTHSIELCGSMFGRGAMSGDGETVDRQWRQLRRHRRFETSFPILQPTCQHSGEALGVYGGGSYARATFTARVRHGGPAVRGGYQGTKAEKAAAMGIDWMTADELNQAIPPDYSEFVATELLREIDRRFGSRFSAAQIGATRSDLSGGYANLARTAAGL